ncbi:MAG: Cna B-type domain-containing protein [Clostridia bacterium]|nr:Cna B-type domain-containing protein [Clostridia bacterium]
MKKKLISIIAFALAATLIAVGLPFAVGASDTFDVEKKGSITLYYTHNGDTFEGLDIKLFRVAELFPDGTYALTGEFSEYPVNIYGITTQEQWDVVASTLASYAIADAIEPSVLKTDSEGRVSYTELATGLYLVLSVNTTNENGAYMFETFMLALPAPDENEVYQYEITAYPKCASYVPSLEYKVVKQWNDIGISDERPLSIEVGIYKDGKLDSVQILSAENDWSYSWKAQDDGSVWTVAELNVPDEYTVTMESNENVFVITNTREVPPPPPPQTGDTSVMWPYILILCLSGAILIAFATRRKRAEF